MTSRTWTQWLTAHDRASLSDTIRAIAGRHGLWTTWLVPAIYAGCLAAFVAGWIFQGIGHARYEKKSPAFFKNLLHLLVGPIFLWNELLHVRNIGVR